MLVKLTFLEGQTKQDVPKDDFLRWKMINDLLSSKQVSHPILFYSTTNKFICLLTTLSRENWDRFIFKKIMKTSFFLLTGSSTNDVTFNRFTSLRILIAMSLVALIMYLVALEMSQNPWPSPPLGPWRHLWLTPKHSIYLKKTFQDLKNCSR